MAKEPAGIVNDRLSIGEFARRTRLPVSTLRYYHDIGLLLPADVDPATGYRRYDRDQVHTAQLIQQLRDAGIGPATIAEMTHSRPLAADILNAERARIDAEIAELRRARRVLDAWSPDGSSTTAPVEEQRPARSVAVAPATTSVDGIGRHVRRELARLRRSHPPNGDASFGATFALDLADPITFAVFHTAPGSTQPTIELAGGLHLVVTHTGDDVHRAYPVLIDALADRSPRHPMVIEDYRNVDDNLVTDVAIPI